MSEERPKQLSFNLTFPEQIDSLQEIFTQLQEVAFSHPMNDPENYDPTVVKLRQLFVHASQVLYTMNEEMIKYYGKHTEPAADFDSTSKPTIH